MGWHRAEHRERNFWPVVSGLVVAGLALPLAQSAWHGPEVAAILAVSAIALLAGQRWAIAGIVLAELFLLPTVWPRALFGSGVVPRLIALGTLIAIIPGVLALPRATAVLAGMTARGSTPRRSRYTHIGLVAIGVFAMLTPLL
jgi:hypothetical protein